MNFNLPIKAVQLDLARQMESISFIKTFIDFAAANHYNTLFLYIEYRVRTGTFDIGAEKGYSAEELTEIIDYAATKNIDVIPGLAVLGHAELLLNDKRFETISELYPDLKGRFKVHTNYDMCLSNPSLRKFIEDYITECAAIFKSPYIHVGGDEAWNVGYCPECRKKVKSFADEAKLYADYFRFCRDIVVNKLNRRMMMWDDMFEYYTSELENMPRDIIMVTWQYQENVTEYQGHFSNLSFCDIAKKYDNLGFDYIFAPAEYAFSNIESISEYASNHKPFGMLMTLWEKQRNLVFRYLPNVAAAGHLWGTDCADCTEAFSKIASNLFGINDDRFIQSLTLSQNSLYRLQQRTEVFESTLLTHSIQGMDSFYLPALELQKQTLKQYSGKTKNDFSELILEELITDCSLKILKLRSINLFFRLLNHQHAESIGNIIRELDQIYIRQKELCNIHRRPCDAKHIEKVFDTWKKALTETFEKIKTQSYIKILFTLVDSYGAQRTTVSIKNNGKYHEIACGCFKGPASNLYYRYFFIEPSANIEALKIESDGFGGQGVCYASIHTPAEDYIPSEILSQTGEVINPQYLLHADAAACFLGHNRIIESFNDRKYAEMPNCIEIKMQKIDFII